MIDSRLHSIVAGLPYPLLFATISEAHLYGVSVAGLGLRFARGLRRGGVLTPSAMPLTNGVGTFTVTVPRGHGTFQAFADFTLTSP